MEQNKNKKGKVKSKKKKISPSIILTINFKTFLGTQPTKPSSTLTNPTKSVTSQHHYQANPDYPL